MTAIRATCLALAVLCLLAPVRLPAASAEEIDTSVAEAIDRFADEVDGARQFLDNAAGYLVFPRVIKVGVGIGGETGEGALLVNSRTEGYYRTTSGSIGFQLGAQAKSIVIAFMTQESLERFRNSSGWRVGVDGSVALVDIGAGRSIDSNNIKDPVVGFVFGSRGLMYNLTLEGSRITEIDRS